MSIELEEPMRLIRSIVVGAAVVSCAAAALFAQGKKTLDPALLTISKTGSVLHTPGVTAIFWGAEWADPAFADDIVTGLDTFFDGYSGSDYAGTATEYSDRSGAITRYIDYIGHAFDLSDAPAPGTLTAAVAVGEACKATNNRPDPGAVYFVFTSSSHGTGACAFHAWGACGSGRNAIPVQVAGIPYASGMAGTGCDALQDSETGHSLALAQIANIAAHELVEAITDPRGTGWRDAAGEEISDKCMRIFPDSSSDYPVFANQSIWKLQGQWSNSAYVAGIGMPNEAGQSGCIFNR
jgi:hypothetical protein